MSTLEVNTINPQSGNDITIGGSSKNIKFPSGTTVDFSTNTPTVTLGATMKNTPTFLSTMSATQTPSSATSTLVNFDQTTYDTGSGYNTSSKKYVIPSAGYYHLYTCVNVYNGNNYSLSLY